MQKTVLAACLLSLCQYAYSAMPFEKLQEIEPHFYQANAKLDKGNLPLQFQLNQQCLQPQTAVKLNQEISLSPCAGEAPIWRVMVGGEYIARVDLRSGTPTLRLSRVPTEPAAQALAESCPTWQGGALDIDVSAVFEEDETLRDFYSGEQSVDKNGKVQFTPAPESQGLILLERQSAVENQKVFDWKNATVYFVLTDRFYNGDPSNDQSYGRRKDGMQEIGTFHGGDLQGLSQKLDYLAALGVNAIWISSPLEQMHGWVGGGDKGDFPHYAYHGYYHQDWTKVDANMGSEQDLAEFIRQAHQRGMRVIFDVVLNHTGYATLADMQQFGFGSLYLKGAEIERILGKNWTDWRPAAGQNWHSFNDFINFNDPQGWRNWWGKDWVRADIGDYDRPKFDDLTMSLASLPDVKTESQQAVRLPPFLARKGNSRATERENTKVREYIIGWLSDWVRRYGVDGFRVDTAKHVEQSTWLALKQAAQQALKDWQRANPDRHFGDDFWMTGEAWGHGVYQSSYYQHGFDAMINFDFQEQAKDALDCFARMEPTYQTMSQKLQNFNVLSYLSSHDTRLFFHSDSQGDVQKQQQAAAALLLAAGAVQIYYGDESGRAFGATGSDPMQGTRSDMNWQELAASPDKQQLLRHWQILSQFRQRHPAIGAGSHRQLPAQPYYAFNRSQGEDKLMVIWAGRR